MELNTLFELPYGTIAEYSPRGISPTSIRSKNACNLIKNGNVELIKRAIAFLKEDAGKELAEFFDEKTILIPIPRSSPLVEGALWPSKIIADLLVNEGYGKEVVTLIKRSKPIRKSSLFYSATTRPTVKEQMDTIDVENQLFTGKKIVLIDDVITAGTISVACAKKILEVYPDIDVKSFAIIRTNSNADIENIISPLTSIIKHYPSGKVFREV